MKRRLSMYNKEEDAETGDKPLFHFDFSQIYHVRTLQAGEHEDNRVKPKDTLRVIQLSYISNGDVETNDIPVPLPTEKTINVRHHSFLELSHFSNAICDVCNKGLPWMTLGSRVPVECKRCHLKSHREHVEGDGDDKLHPCIASEREVKKLLVLASKDDDRDFWVDQLSKVTLVLSLIHI